MAITDKTRKTLWARSGNRCAMCRIELVAERDLNSKSLNLGDECHIISEKGQGPRHDSEYKEDFDDYDNLILLCKNHHRTIDELYETYPAELLRSIKKNHEKWVKDTLDESKGNQKSKIKFLPKLTGKMIVDIINGVHASECDHDELATQNEVDVIGVFFESISDWIDLIGMGVVEKGQIIQLGFDLDSQLRELEDLGFLVFGERKKSRMVDGNKTDLGVWDVAVIIAVRKTNPAITPFGTLALASKSK